MTYYPVILAGGGVSMADAAKIYGPLALKEIRRRELDRFLDGRVRARPAGDGVSIRRAAEVAPERSLAQL